MDQMNYSFKFPLLQIFYKKGYNSLNRGKQSNLCNLLLGNIGVCYDVAFLYKRHDGMALALSRRSAVAGALPNVYHTLFSGPSD